MIMHEPTSQIMEKYLESSICVVSSRYEGFSMAIVEAMACGLPVVSFDCPWGPRSIIKNGVDGILVENGNPSALAEGIVSFIRDDNRRKAMADAAHRNVKRFSIDQIALQWKRLFEETLETI